MSPLDYIKLICRVIYSTYKSGRNTVSVLKAVCCEHGIPFCIKYDKSKPDVLLIEVKGNNRRYRCLIRGRSIVKHYIGCCKKMGGNTVLNIQFDSEHPSEDIYE